jgi:hypothetical protein
MDWDILIPILMFFFPLLAALLDKRAKRRKEVPPVKARPVVFPSAESGSEVPPGKRPAAPDPSQRRGRWAPPSYGAEDGYGFPKGTPATAPVSAEGKPQKETPTRFETEGQRAIVREKQVELQDDKPKLEIDKKKLILYSEILKPKFDA